MTEALAAKATTFAELHSAPEILQVVNVWDVISAKTIADIPGTKALATASHSIAASLGYEDGENIPVDEMITAVGRIAAATDLPVSADLESGYGNPGETVRRAIGVGIVGANIEDQLRPLADSVALMEAVLKAGRAEGVDFVLNARADVFTLGGDRDPATILADAVERGQAYLAAGATNVFIPGQLDEHAVTTLVEAFGQQRLSVINVPGSLSPSRLQELGVARISYGPWTQRVALTALANSARELLADGQLPEGTLPLN